MPAPTQPLYQPSLLQEHHLAPHPSPCVSSPLIPVARGFLPQRVEQWPLTLSTEGTGLPWAPDWGSVGSPGAPTLLPSPRPALTVLEVESVEVHPFNQVAQGFRLKRGQAWVADFPGGQTQVRRGPSEPGASIQPPPCGEALQVHPPIPEQARRPDSRVGLEVAIIDSLDELLRDLDDLLRPRCRETAAQ